MLLLQYSTFLLDGLRWTLLLSACVVCCATLIAIVFAAGLVRRNRLVRGLSFGVVEILRDIPLFVTVLCTYFILPAAGLSLSPFWSTVLSLSLWGGANGSQIIRAGLTAVPQSQREAALSVGLRSWKAMRLVILPQAMPVILPPYVGLVTSLVQATSLGAVVGVHELLRSGQILIEQTTIMNGGNPAFLVYGAILVVYFVLCWSIAGAGKLLERHFDRPYRRPAAEARTGAAHAAVAQA